MDMEQYTQMFLKRVDENRDYNELYYEDPLGTLEKFREEHAKDHGWLTKFKDHMLETSEHQAVEHLRMYIK